MRLHGRGKEKEMRKTGRERERKGEEGRSQLIRIDKKGADVLQVMLLLFLFLFFRSMIIYLL